MGICFQEAKSRILGCIYKLLNRCDDFIKIIENKLPEFTNLISNKETKAKELLEKGDLKKIKKICSTLQFLIDLIEFVKNTLPTLRQTLNEVRQSQNCITAKKLFEQINEIREFVMTVNELFNDDDNEEEETTELEEQRLKLINELLEKIGSSQEEFERKVEEKMGEIAYAGIQLTLTSVGN